MQCMSKTMHRLYKELSEMQQCVAKVYSSAAAGVMLLNPLANKFLHIMQLRRYTCMLHRPNGGSAGAVAGTWTYAYSDADCD